MNLLGILNPDVEYVSWIKPDHPPGDDIVNATLKMKVRLAVKNADDTEWREYATKDKLSRHLSCKLPADKVNKENLFTLPNVSVCSVWMETSTIVT